MICHIQSYHRITVISAVPLFHIVGNISRDDLHGSVCGQRHRAMIAAVMVLLAEAMVVTVVAELMAVIVVVVVTVIVITVVVRQ